MLRPVRESFLVLRAVARVMRDSERTEEIHLTEEITGRRRLRAVLAEQFHSDEARELLAARAELRSDQVDYDALRALSADTLGGAYVRYLDDNGLSADFQAAPTRYIDDPEVAWLARRFRQTHDVWHAAVGLGIAGHEEVLVHAFSWAQARLPVSALVVTFGTPKHILGERRWELLRRGLRDAWESGRDAAPLLPVYWERYWEQPLDAVRARLGIRPLAA